MTIRYTNEKGYTAKIEYVDMSLYKLPNYWMLTIDTGWDRYRNTYKTLKGAKIALGKYPAKFTEVK